MNEPLSAGEPPIWVAALYVPADRPDRYEKAASSGADLVIVDLEDAVVPEKRMPARTSLVDWLQRRGTSAVPIAVRINPVDSSAFDDDVGAVRECAGAVAMVRASKVQDAESAGAVVSALAGTGARIVCQLESALAVEHAYEIASTEGVSGITLGEEDLKSDLGVRDPSAALSWARGRLVVAARAAGLSEPMMSAFTDIRDLDGLAESTLQARNDGFIGRTAIHPSQISTIVRAFTPSESEVERARAVLDGLAGAAADGRSVVRLADGRMVDPASARLAQTTLRLQAAIAAMTGPPPAGP
jgi:citrate lyase subunit beta/citryl-CoA lyase